MAPLSPVWAREAAEAKQPNPGRANPLLRAYFRRQLVGFESLKGTPQEAGSLFLEKIVDQQVDHFLRRLKKKLTQLEGSLAELERLRTEGAVEDPARRAELGASLSRLEKLCHSLRRQLSAVITLKQKSRSQAKSASGGDPWDYLIEQVQGARRRIQEYFFGSTHTIESHELAGGNMLVRLRRAEKAAARIRREL